jgi:hypothetical protein
MNLLSFDIEIADVFDLKIGESIEKYAPFHISVAATAVHNGEELLWYSTGDDGRPLPWMTKEKAGELLEFLKAKQDEGYLVCAWNGLKFDMRWIGYAAGNMKLAAEVALNICDPMFQFFNRKGFPVSLAAVAKAMGINQSKLMDSEDAPLQWQAGNYRQVMDYVIGDCQMTNLIAAQIIKRKKIQWYTQRNEKKTEAIPRLKTVAQVLKDPEPDQSWMKTKMPRKAFYGWFR